MFVIRHKKMFLIISGALVGLSLLTMFIFGLPLGRDFVGGSLLEAEYLDERPDTALIRESISEERLANVLLQPTGEKGIIVRTISLDDDAHKKLMDAISFNGERDVEEKRFDSVGPIIGKELRQKALTAIALVVVAIILFVAYAFRDVSKIRGSRSKKSIHDTGSG